ncbi:MAG TPA: hypothetical protein DDY13_09495 [Cytophagales bacterium]|mgnify:CR=1 FL=1|jgi:nucleotide-binding universal stress UspA family protein|nr:hypothetical protein [Cytophagales bacterium]
MLDQKKWGVFLDGSLSDHFMLQNCMVMAEKFQPTDIYIFKHFEKPNIPKLIYEHIPDLHEPEKNYLKSQLMRELINYDFGKPRVHVKILEGSQLSSILNFANKTQLDLLLATVKKNMPLQGEIASKIARKGPCSMMILPDRQIDSFGHIFSPVDFSSYTDLCVKASKSLYQNMDGRTITFHHSYYNADKYLNSVYETPLEVHDAVNKKSLIDQKLYDYYYFKLHHLVAGDTPDELRHEKLSLRALGPQETLGHSIISEIEVANPDIIVLGARGQSKSVAVLLGGTTESVLSLYHDVPILIMRQPGDNKGIIRSLLRKTQ